MQKLISSSKYRGQEILYDIIIICRLLKRMTLDLYHFIRSQSQITKMFGLQYKRSYQLVEIDITYRCNLRCVNCNRSCAQAPSEDEITIEQIEEFINDSVSRNIKWKRVRLLGGEPALHSRFFTILRLLLAYKYFHNNDLRIIVATNGFGDYVNKILSKIPKEIDIENTYKGSKKPRFFPFNLAPKDSCLYNNVDYSNGCRVVARDGMGLTPYGYYHCAIAGSIDRIFNFDIGRKEIPLYSDLMIDQLQTFCRLCGHFRFSFPTKRAKVSNSWEIAYKLYNDNRKNNNGDNIRDNTDYNGDNIKNIRDNTED